MDSILSETFKNNHPFEVLMDSGKCTQSQIQSWICNRYCFQKTMVAKDSIILSKCPDRTFRQMWIKRIIEADAPDGGLESWIRLGVACGIDATDSTKVYPATKFAMDSFLNWCTRTDWKIVVASSLSQLNAVVNHRRKFATWYELYPWIETGGLDYFLLRIDQVDIDSKKCLEFVQLNPLSEESLREATTIKREIMKCMLDSIYFMNLV